MKNENKLNILVGINSFVVVVLLFLMIILANNVIVAADDSLFNILGIFELSKFGVVLTFILGTVITGYETYKILKSIDKSKKQKQSNAKQQKEDEFELLKKQIAKVQKLANKNNIE